MYTVAVQCLKRVLYDQRWWSDYQLREFYDLLTLWQRQLYYYIYASNFMYMLQVIN